MGILSNIMGMLPTITVMNSTLPKWMELMAAVVVVVLLVLSMLPRVSKMNKQLGMGSESSDYGGWEGNDYGAMQ